MRLLLSDQVPLNRRLRTPWEGAGNAAPGDEKSSPLGGDSRADLQPSCWGKKPPTLRVSRSRAAWFSSS